MSPEYNIKSMWRFARRGRQTILFHSSDRWSINVRDPIAEFLLGKSAQFWLRLSSVALWNRWGKSWCRARHETCKGSQEARNLPTSFATELSKLSCDIFSLHSPHFLTSVLIVSTSSSNFLLSSKSLSPLLLYVVRFLWCFVKRSSKLE